MNLLFANDRRGTYPPSVYAETRTPLPDFPEQRGEEREPKEADPPSHRDRQWLGRRQFPPWE